MRSLPRLLSLGALAAVPFASYYGVRAVAYRSQPQARPIPVRAPAPEVLQAGLLPVTVETPPNRVVKKIRVAVPAAAAPEEPLAARPERAPQAEAPQAEAPPHEPEPPQPVAPEPEPEPECPPCPECPPPAPRTGVSYIVEPMPPPAVRRAIQKVPGLRLLQRWRYKAGDRFAPARTLVSEPLPQPEHSGVVRVVAKVDEHGRVRDTRSHGATGDAAESAVLNWTFEPARLGNSPVESEVIIYFTFTR